MSSSEITPPTEAQFLILINELETDGNFFEKHKVSNSGSLWQPVVDKMNAIGSKKTIDEWRVAFKGLKYKARKRYLAVDPNIPGSLTNLKNIHRRLLLVLGQLDVNSCRKCNKKHSDKEIFYPLFEDMNTLTTLTEKARMYTKITKMQILQYDLLPCWLCSECWKKCEDWHDFMKNCNRFNDDNYKIAMENRYQNMFETKKMVRFKRKPTTKRPAISKPKQKQKPKLKKPKTSTDNSSSSHSVENDSNCLLNTEPVETIFIKQEPLDIKQEENVDMVYDSSFGIAGITESVDIDMKVDIKQEEL